jgi:hypothetical protein
MAKAKPTRAHAHWTEQEDSALLLGVGSHTPIDQVARFLQRPIAAVFKRLHVQHREAWQASGHPPSHPWKSEGMARAREAVRLVPPPAEPQTVSEDLPPWAAALVARIQEQEDALAFLRGRLARMAHDLGEDL